MSAAARTLTDEELEAMLERAAERGAARALASIHARDVKPEDAALEEHVPITAAIHASAARRLARKSRRRA